MLKNISIIQNTDSIEIRHNNETCIIPPKYMDSFWHIVNANNDSRNPDQLIAYDYICQDHICFISECLSAILGVSFDNRVKYVNSLSQYDISPLSFEIYEDKILRLRKLYCAKTLDNQFIDSRKDKLRDENSTHIGLFHDGNLIGCCRTTDCHTGTSYLEEINLLNNSSFLPNDTVEISRFALDSKHKNKAIQLIKKIKIWLTQFTEYQVAYAMCSPSLAPLYTRTGAEIVKKFNIYRGKPTEFVLVRYIYPRK